MTAIVSPKKTPDWILPAAVFAAGLFANLPFIARTITVDDSAEFVTAAVTNGIAHPSGYPLYVLLAHLFTFIPFGHDAWRVALMSAVCSAAALAAAAVLVRTAARRLGASFGARETAATALVLTTLDVGTTWWSYSVQAEVYSLHVLLVLLTALALLRWTDRHTVGDAAVLGLAYGLCLSDHLFLGLGLAPFLAIAAVMDLAGASRKTWKKEVGLGLLGLVVGLLPYGVIALKAYFGAGWAFFKITDAKTYWQYVRRATYADVGLAGKNKFGLFTSYVGQLANELGIPVLALAGVGLGACVREKRLRPLAIWAAGALSVPVLVIIFRTAGWSMDAEHAYAVFAMQSLAAAAVLAGVGAVVGLRRLETYHPAIGALTWGSATIVAVVIAATALPTVVTYRLPFVDAVARRAMASLPPDAVMIVCDDGVASDTWLFSLTYLQVAEGIRSDVTLASDIGFSSIHRPALPFGYAALPDRMRDRVLIGDTIKDPALQGRPFFSTCAPEAALAAWRSAADGTAYELLPGDRTTSTAVPQPAVPVPAGIDASYDLRGFVAEAMYREAAHLVDVGQESAAAHMVVDAVGYDTMPLSPEYLGAVAHRDAVVRARRNGSAAPETPAKAP